MKNTIPIYISILISFFLTISQSHAHEINKDKIETIIKNFLTKNPNFIKSTLDNYNLSLEIKKGERIAIVGPTGSGKSTIIKLILRFFELNSGKINIDDVNIKDYSLKNLRSQISLVSQDIFLFADSIYNNISLFNKEISDKDVEAAAKQIGILDFI